MPTEKKIRRTLWLLMVVSFVARLLVAIFSDLGNDEVYYWTYARYPALSHFDHPPMVGWVIQLFTLNLHFDSAFFIRLGAVVFGVIDTWLIFLIGKHLRDSLTGLYAALLFTASFYCSIISGAFIMPDTPQVLFWLLTLYLLIQALPDKQLTPRSRTMMLLSGVAMGLAMLSKYHSVFLPMGVLLYILLFTRKWLLAKETYIAFLITLLAFLPVVIWNVQNDFISFTFHEGRLGSNKSFIRPDYFFTELFGQFFYNNPVNVILILVAFISLFRGNRMMKKEDIRFLLIMSLPLAVVFLSFSVFSSTLPHWTGPAYLGFMLIAAAYLRSVNEGRQVVRLVPWSLRVALSLPVFILLIGLTQINFGWLPLKRLKAEDFSAQLYGWDQLREKFADYAKRNETLRIMPENAPILSFRWFPAANLDFYVATPLGHPLFAMGTLERIHKYYWIDKARGPLKQGSSAYFITFLDDNPHPRNLFGNLYDSIYIPDTLSIIRGKDVIRRALVYKLTGLSRNVTFGNINDFKEPSGENIQYNKAQIYSNPDRKRALEEKAVREQRPMHDVLWQETKWMYEREMYK
jgi:hypothetical protein